MKKIIFSAFLLTGLFLILPAKERPRIREFGIPIGILQPGPYNSITDVSGVKVGHVTLIINTHIRTGVTAILPHSGNIFQDKIPAAVYVANGYGKLMGSTQVEELGNMETPIILTNTLSVPTAANALITFVLSQPGNQQVASINALVGETNDGWLNDIRGRYVTEDHILEAIKKASPGPVEEGAVGAGTGTICFGFKGGIGTSSRKLPESKGGYTVGVLVQSNHGGILRINGFPVGKELRTPVKKYPLKKNLEGSCMVVVATDAPLDSRNLKRLAKRALLGIARTGGYYSNGSGDYAIAFSTAKEVRLSRGLGERTLFLEVLKNQSMSPLFLAAAEATEEAILNSMFKAKTMTGQKNRRINALPIERIKILMKGFLK